MCSRDKAAECHPTDRPHHCCAAHPARALCCVALGTMSSREGVAAVVLRKTMVSFGLANDPDSPFDLRRRRRRFQTEPGVAGHPATTGVSARPVRSTGFAQTRGQDAVISNVEAPMPAPASVFATKRVPHTLGKATSKAGGSSSVPSIGGLTPSQIVNSVSVLAVVVVAAVGMLLFQGPDPSLQLRGHDVGVRGVPDEPVTVRTTQQSNIAQPAAPPRKTRKLNELQEWAQWLKDYRATIAEYPQGRFSGRGIVLSAGGRIYFTSAYVTIRVLRDVHKCTLPIEVFYNGPEELPQSAIDLMTKTYNVRFVDVTKFAETEDVNLKGYQLKAFTIYLSSFEEVLWLDSDNIPLRDPEFLFQSQLYVTKGALFWPDFCNMVSFRKETFNVFGLPTPSYHPQPRTNKTTVWPRTCTNGVATELETGQVLINKRRRWTAMMMTVFINRNHWFFLKRLFQGDKMTFHFGFKAAGEEYGLVPHNPGAVGKISRHENEARFFCGNTMAQHSPDDGSMIFMHRTMAKYKDAGTWTKGDGQLGWDHVATQPARSSWMLWYRDELPASLFLGSSASDQYECAHPEGPGTTYEAAPKSLQQIEQQCIGFLRELEDLPFYPKNRRCTAESMFFCKHP